MSDDNTITAEQWAALDAAGVQLVMSGGGRDWAFKKPSKAQYSAFKVDLGSQDRAKAADAFLDLAKTCLVPMPGTTREAERAAWDDLCEEYPGAADEIGTEVLKLAEGPQKVVRRERPGSSAKPSETRK